MKRLITTILIIVTVITTMALPVNADNRYIEGTFTYGSYAPHIHIINAGLSTALEVNSNGSLSWKKLRNNNDYNDVSQYFVIVPAGNGYYAIQEMLPMGGHNPRVLTYKAGKGFFMEWATNGKIGDTQKFKFKWYSSTTCAGRTIKNCWRIVCKKDNIAFCKSGWGTVRIILTNA